jgi:hypothetical protein
LQLVFKAAYKEGWIAKGDVKRIRQDVGESPVPRAVFDLGEFKKILELTDGEWIASGKTEKCRQALDSGSTV